MPDSLLFIYFRNLQLQDLPLKSDLRVRATYLGKSKESKAFKAYAKHCMVNDTLELTLDTHQLKSLDSMDYLHVEIVEEFTGVAIGQFTLNDFELLEATNR